MKNLILIGVMGCGKTTIGKMISKRLKMSFFDMDDCLEKKYGPIPALFEKGEAYFRDLESEMVRELSKLDNSIISTGGGVIKRPENMTILKENGIVLFLDRPIHQIMNDIDTSKRPLLKDGPDKLLAIYHERYPLYRAACDYRIDASGGLQYTIAQIRAIWKRENATILNE